MRHLIFAPIVLSVAALSLPAEAALTLKLDGYTLNGTTANNASLYRTFAYKVDSLGTTAIYSDAGQLGGTLDLGTGAGPKSFAAYCVELTQSLVPFPGTYTNYTSALGSAYWASKPTVLDNVSRLFSENIVFDNVNKTAAFQIALWELIYETSGTFLVGDGAANIAGTADFTSYLANPNANPALLAGTATDAATFSLARSYLSAVSSTPVSVVLTVYQSPTQQDLIVATSVPEPASLALMFAGLIGVGCAGAARARRQR